MNDTSDIIHCRNPECKHATGVLLQYVDMDDWNGCCFDSFPITFEGWIFRPAWHIALQVDNHPKSLEETLKLLEECRNTHSTREKRIAAFSNRFMNSLYDKFVNKHKLKLPTRERLFTPNGPYSPTGPQVMALAAFSEIFDHWSAKLADPKEI